jgi:hypothetical protein
MALCAYQDGSGAGALLPFFAKVCPRALMFDLYSLTTSHLTLVCCRSGSGQMFTGQEPDAACRPVYLYMPGNSAGRCCLFAAGEAPPPLMLPPDERRSILLPVHAHLIKDEQHAALLHPVTRKYLCTATPDPGNSHGDLGMIRTRLDEGGIFRLRPADEANVAEQVWRSLPLFARAAENEITTATIIQILEMANAREADLLLNAIWPFLALRELETLGQTIFTSPPLQNRIAALLPHDLWATRGLAALAAHTSAVAGAPVRSYQIGPELDALASAGFGGSLVSFGHAANTYARASTKPSQALCIVATARNEGIYLIEWLAYHRAIGIDQFFLYSNDNDDGSDELLSRLAEAGAITWIHNQVAPQISAQGKAYGHAFGLLGEVLRYRWAAVIDLDEFLVFDPLRFTSIIEFVSWHEMREGDAIACNWAYVGSGQPPGPQRELLIRRNRRLLGPQHVGEGYRLVKMIVRPRRVMHSRPHNPITDELRQLVYRYSDGEPHSFHRSPGGANPAFADQPNADCACIYHYLFKSPEEFLWKLARNRGDHPLRSGLGITLDRDLVQTFLGQLDAEDVEMNDRIDLCAPDLESAIAELMALPGVEAANDRVQSNYTLLQSYLAQGFRSSAVFSRIDRAGQRLLRLAGIQPDTTK